MKFAGGIALSAMLIAAPALAQQARDVVELTQSVIQTKRKLIVATNLGLTEEQSELFWPVYKDFQEALRTVNDRRADVILELAREYDGLTGEKAQELLKQSLDIEAKRTALKKKFIGKFNAVLPPKTVVRYFQIENKLDSIINFELAGAIPLVPPDVAAPPQ